MSDSERPSRTDTEDFLWLASEVERLKVLRKNLIDVLRKAQPFAPPDVQDAIRAAITEAEAR